jgi:hypothetical protein
VRKHAVKLKVYIISREKLTMCLRKCDVSVAKKKTSLVLVNARYELEVFLLVLVLK